MANEENYDHFPCFNYFEKFKRDVENDRIVSDAKNIAEKKEKEKLQKAQIKIWNENYNKRKYYDLTWRPEFQPTEEKWNYTDRVLNYGDDMYNFSVKSPYPADYDCNKNKCVRISTGNLIFYSEVYFNRTLNTEISNFHKLNGTPEKNEKLGLIPSGTYVNIIETITHKRKIKNSDRSYFYIMCKVEMDTLFNTDLSNPGKEISDTIKRGDIGYIWHTFMGTDNPGSKTNVVYVAQLGALHIMDFLTKPDPVSDYFKNTIKLENVTLTFEASSYSTRDYNSLEKIKTTYKKLFNTFDAAAKEASVKEIHIYALNYGGSGSHNAGIAADITTITTNDGFHENFKIYKKSTGIWSNLEQSKAIHDFEEAFMRQPNSERIWAPWFFHEKDKDTIPNLISAYPIIGTLPDDKTFKVKAYAILDQKYPQKDHPKYIEYADIIENGTKYKDNNVKKAPEPYKDTLRDVIIRFLIEDGDISVPQDWDSREKLRLHWEHRHHGHYQIKKS